LNFSMEDIIRDLFNRNITDYVNTMVSFCPESVVIRSNDHVEILGGKFPLFSVDLKFVNGTVDSPAKFVYSSSPEAIV